MSNVTARHHILFKPFVSNNVKAKTSGIISYLTTSQNRRSVYYAFFSHFMPLFPMTIYRFLLKRCHILNRGWKDMNTKPLGLQGFTSVFVTHQDNGNSRVHFLPLSSCLYISISCSVNNAGLQVAFIRRIEDCNRN